MPEQHIEDATTTRPLEGVRLMDMKDRLVGVGDFAKCLDRSSRMPRPTSLAQARSGWHQMPAGIPHWACG